MAKAAPRGPKGCRVLWLRMGVTAEGLNVAGGVGLGASTAGVGNERDGVEVDSNYEVKEVGVLTKICEACRKAKPLKEFRLPPADGRAKLPPPSRKCVHCIDELWRKNGWR